MAPQQLAGLCSWLCTKLISPSPDVSHCQTQTVVLKAACLSNYRGRGCSGVCAADVQKYTLDSCCWPLMCIMWKVNCYCCCILILLICFCTCRFFVLGRCWVFCLTDFVLCKLFFTLWLLHLTISLYCDECGGETDKMRLVSTDKTGVLRWQSLSLTYAWGVLVFFFVKTSLHHRYKMFSCLSEAPLHTQTGFNYHNR